MEKTPADQEWLEQPAALTGRVVKYVGAISSMADHVTIEKIETEEGDVYYRMTEVDDIGCYQSTWPSALTPFTVVWLMRYIDKLGSRVQGNTLYGPHLMRKHAGADRTILRLQEPIGSTEFVVRVDKNTNLFWYESLLAMIDDQTGLGETSQGETNPTS